LRLQLAGGDSAAVQHLWPAPIRPGGHPCHYHPGAHAIHGSAGQPDTTRDFTYVQDTVNGFIKAIQAEGVEGGQFNLGTGAEIRVGELAENIIRKVGRPVTISLDPLRLRPEKSEVLRLISDNRLAREHLGWQPQTSWMTDWIRLSPGFLAISSCINRMFTSFNSIIGKGLPRSTKFLEWEKINKKTLYASLNLCATL